MEYPCAILDHHHYHTTVQQQFSPFLAQIMHNSKELCSVIMEGSRRDEKARYCYLLQDFSPESLAEKCSSLERLAVPSVLSW
ncbi:unnamed protein product [Sphagnum compactum]